VRVKRRKMILGKCECGIDEKEPMMAKTGKGE
jgi:hypothetical protein